MLDTVAAVLASAHQGAMIGTATVDVGKVTLAAELVKAEKATSPLTLA